MFNDTFKLFPKGKTSASDAIKIDETGIAWSSDLQYKFKNIEKNLPTGKKWQDVQWLDM